RPRHRDPARRRDPGGGRRPRPGPRLRRGRGEGPGPDRRDLRAGGARMRVRLHRRMPIASLALAFLAGVATAYAQPDETAGMITEIKVGRGTVEMKTADGDWRRAAPLSALRVGDEVRAVGDASAVVLLTGGRGTVLVKAKNSPYLVGAPRAKESTA